MLLMLHQFETTSGSNEDATHITHKTATMHQMLKMLCSTHIPGTSVRSIMGNAVNYTMDIFS